MALVWILGRHFLVTGPPFSYSLPHCYDFSFHSNLTSLTCICFDSPNSSISERQYSPHFQDRKCSYRGFLMVLADSHHSRTCFSYWRSVVLGAEALHCSMMGVSKVTCAHGLQLWELLLWPKAEVTPAAVNWRARWEELCQSILCSVSAYFFLSSFAL